MKDIDIKKYYSFLTLEDKEISQGVDFDSRCFHLQNIIQELYDKAHVSEKASLESKSKLDLIYTYIEEVSRLGDELLEDK